MDPEHVRRRASHMNTSEMANSSEMVGKAKQTGSGQRQPSRDVRARPSKVKSTKRVVKTSLCAPPMVYKMPDGAKSSVTGKAGVNNQRSFWGEEDSNSLQEHSSRAMNLSGVLDQTDSRRNLDKTVAEAIDQKQYLIDQHLSKMRALDAMPATQEQLKANLIGRPNKKQLPRIIEPMYPNAIAYQKQ